MEKYLQNSTPRAWVFYLFLFSFVGSFIAGAILAMIGLAMPSFDEGIGYYRLSIVLQDVFMMFLPAYTVSLWISDNPMQSLGLKRSKKMLRSLLYGLLIFFVSYPFIGVIAQWNEQVVLPESLKLVEQWMRSLEDSAKQVTDQFLAGKTVADLLLNLLLIAAAAAFVEELFFRGALQQFLEKWLRNGHAAVWIGAVVFSAIHLQFYGFFPRLIMGAILGYLFLYSRNLWIPMLYHFVNNATVVVVTYFGGDNNLLEQLEDKELNWASLVVAIISAWLTVYFFSRYKKRMKNDSN